MLHKSVVVSTLSFSLTLICNVNCSSEIKNNLFFYFTLVIIAIDVFILFKINYLQLTCHYFLNKIIMHSIINCALHFDHLQKRRSLCDKKNSAIIFWLEVIIECYSMRVIWHGAKQKVMKLRLKSATFLMMWLLCD